MGPIAIGSGVVTLAVNLLLKNPLPITIGTTAAAVFIVSTVE